MITVMLPDRPIAAKIDWRPRQPTQVNRSEFTGRSRSVVLAEAAFWAAGVTYPTIIGEAAFRPWRSALMRLQGRANAFRLIAVEGPQQRFHQTVVVDGGGQQGYTLATRGWAPGGQLRDGMMITAGERLLQVVADTRIAGADGKLSISVMPHVPAVLADGATIEVNRPWALMRLAQDQQGWTVDRGQTYTVSFDCEEAL